MISLLAFALLWRKVKRGLEPGGDLAISVAARPGSATATLHHRIEGPIAIGRGKDELEALTELVRELNS